MNRKILFGLCMFSIMLLISTPSAEASLWDDFISWIKELLGFETKEQAENYLEEVFLNNIEMQMKEDTWIYIEEQGGSKVVYTPFSKRTIGGMKKVDYVEAVCHAYETQIIDGESVEVCIDEELILRQREVFDKSIVNLEVSSNVLEGYVLRNGKPIKAKEAGALTADDGVNFNLDIDPKYPLEIENYNYSEEEGKWKLYLKNIKAGSSELNKDLPLEVYERNKTSDKELKHNETKKFYSADEKGDAVVDFSIGDNLKYGLASSTVNMTANDSFGFYDARFETGGVEDRTYGGATSIHFRAAGAVIIVNTTYFISSSNISFEGVGFEFYANYVEVSGSGDIFQEYDIWEEGTGSNVIGNVSYNYANDSDTGWTGATRQKRSFVGQTPTISGVGWVTANLTNLTALNDLHTDLGYLNLYLVDTGGLYAQFDSAEGANAWSINMTYTLSEAGVDPTFDSVDLLPEPDTNYTDSNITLRINNVNDAENDVVYNITDWEISTDGGATYVSDAAFNMPLTVGSNVTQTIDYSINQKNANVVGAVVNNTNGVYGYGAYFDGVDDYIDTSLTSNADFLNGFTISAWIKADSAGEGTTDNLGRILDKSTGTGGQNGFTYRFISSNNIQFVLGGLGVNSATNSIIFGNWYHTILTINSSSLTTIYINGTQSGTPETTGALSGINTTNALRIGNRAGATDRTFNGSISDVKIWNRTLSADEILAIYNNETILHSGAVLNYGAGSLIRANVTVNDGDGDGDNKVSAAVTILSSIQNITSLILNSTEEAQTNYTNESLSCNFLCEDIIAANTITYDLEFWNATALIYSEYAKSCTNPSFNAITLTEENTTTLDIYSCNANLTSSTGETTATAYSNNLTIEGVSPSNLTWNTPGNLTIFTDNSIVYNASADDEDGDTVYFEFYQDAFDTNPPTTLLSNETSPATNLSTDGNYWVRVRAVDGFGGQSNYLDSRYITIDNSTVKNYTADYPNNITEGTFANFTLNASHNIYNLNWTNAALIWQNTEYSTSQQNSSATENIFSSGFNIPQVSADTSAEFYWNISYAYSNGTEGSELTANFTQDVQNIGFFSCDGVSNSSQAFALNYTFFREINNTQIIAGVEEDGSDFDGVFELWTDLPSTNVTLTFALTNKTEIDVCIDPPEEEFKSNAFLSYVKNGFDARQYYMSNSTVNNQTQNISLYLLDQLYATARKIQVRDRVGEGVSGVYIYADKFFIGENIFRLIAMGLTNDAGDYWIYMKSDDTFYRFMLVQDGEVKYLDPQSRQLGVTETTILLRIDSDSFADELGRINDLQYGITNTSSTIILEYLDSVSSTNCLSVIRRNSTYDDWECNSCQTAAQGTITCDFNQSGDYTWAYYSTSPSLTKLTNLSSPYILVDSGTLAQAINRELASLIGLTGVFASFFTILTLGMIGVAMGGVSTTIVGTLIGVLISIFMELMTVTWSVAIGLVVLGGIIIILSRE